MKDIRAVSIGVLTNIVWAGITWFAVLMFDVKVGIKLASIVGLSILLVSIAYPGFSYGYRTKKVELYIVAIIAVTSILTLIALDLIFVLELDDGRSVITGLLNDFAKSEFQRSNYKFTEDLLYLRYEDKNQLTEIYTGLHFIKSLFFILFYGIVIFTTGVIAYYLPFTKK